ncbi:MAG: AAA family ATPase [Pseudonocardiales bacterium]
MWRADAVRGGLDPDALMDQVLARYRTGATVAPVEANSELEARFGISLDDLVTKLTDPEQGLTAHARRFSHLDAIAAVADALPHGAEIQDVERLADLALAHPAFEALPAAGAEQSLGGPGAHTPLAGAHQMTGGQLYTTRDVTAAERTILAAATAASDPAAGDAQDRAVVPAATVDLAVTVVETAQGFPLSAEQRDVLHRVVTTGRAVEAVEGPPGTGKTTLMRAAWVAAMVSTWLRLRAGAPDPHTQTAGLLMLAATNEQVARINDATQAVRQARGELGDGATYRLPGGRETRFHVGDLVLIRRNDRHQQAVTGDAVLNGYRGVVTAVTPDGVEVAWRDPATEPDAELSTAVLSPGYIARGGLELGYALTAHKAEGLTVGAQWERPDGTRNHGSVLVYGPGLDNPGLYVSLSRDKGQVVLFGARAELEGEREDLVYGPPRNQTELTDRVIAALAERAAATATTANDRPVLVDLGQAPADPTGTGVAGGTGTTPGTVPPVPVPQPDADQPGDQPGERPAEPQPPQRPQPRPEPVAEPVAEPVTVTDEQRRQWRELVHRSGVARRAGDYDAHQAIQAQRQALITQLGPERVEVLRAESHQRTLRSLERLRLTTQWQTRPHSRLTNTELTRAIRHAEQRQAEHHAAADRARQQLAEREPSVEAGRGRRRQSPVPAGRRPGRRAGSPRRRTPTPTRRPHRVAASPPAPGARRSQLRARPAPGPPGRPERPRPATRPCHQPGDRRSRRRHPTRRAARRTAAPRHHARSPNHHRTPAPHPGHRTRAAPRASHARTPARSVPPVRTGLPPALPPDRHPPRRPPRHRPGRPQPRSLTWVSESDDGRAGRIAASPDVSPDVAGGAVGAMLLS